MNRWRVAAILFAALPLVSQLGAQQPSSLPTASPTQLTIYNGDFAVARTSVPLDLHAGMNEVLTTDVTSQLEPDSVVLRDAAGHRVVHVMEQNYDAGVVNQQWLLNKYEGKTLDFETMGMQVIETSTGEHKTLPATIVQGRIVRAGTDPLVEVNGHLQFHLPGIPLFPATTDGLLLKPTLRWQIESPKPEHFTAELDYITHGMSWQATYNVIVPELADVSGSELADVLGWVTIQNNSGTDFPQATVQLMAGDVAKLPQPRSYAMGGVMARNAFVDRAAAPEVTQKAFDDFHLYDLHRTVSLRDKESKQVQFLDASGVTVTRSYQYEGNAPSYQNFYAGYHNDQRNFENGDNKKVAIHEEIRNTEANHLGMPLPAGRVRVYRREVTGQMQFVGENMVPHTPADQKVQITSGDAFDLTGERRQTDFHVDNGGHNMDESFEIKLSNAKAQPVTIHAVEHMNRGQNWQITEKSTAFDKRDSGTIDFPMTVPAKGSTTLKYSVHYTWD